MSDNLTKDLEAASNNVEKLVAAVKNAPHPAVASFIDERVGEMMRTEMPKLLASTLLGPVERREDADSLLQIYESGLEATEDGTISPEVEAAGTAIAEVVQDNIDEILEGETYHSRIGYADIVTAYAALVAGLQSLKMDDSERAWAEAQEGKDAEPDSETE